MKPKIQMCCQCDQPTGRCEDDELYIYGDKESDGPYCEECYEAITGRKASVKYFDSGGKKR